MNHTVCELLMLSFCNKLTKHVFVVDEVPAEVVLGQQDRLEMFVIESQCLSFLNGPETSSYYVALRPPTHLKCVSHSLNNNSFFLQFRTSMVE